MFIRPRFLGLLMVDPKLDMRNSVLFQVVNNRVSVDPFIFILLVDLPPTCTGLKVKKIIIYETWKEYFQCIYFRCITNTYMVCFVISSTTLSCSSIPIQSGNLKMRREISSVTERFSFIWLSSFPFGERCKG